MSLHYRCQSENAADRELRRIRRGRYAIWGRDTPDINFLMLGLSTYRKPKGMHWRHHERRVRKQYDAEQVFLRALLVLLRRRYRGKMSRRQEGHKQERQTGPAGRNKERIRHPLFRSGLNQFRL